MFYTSPDVKLHVVTSLQKQENNVSLEEHQNLQAEHYHLLVTIQEKSRNVAQLMRTAASKTEPQIKYVSISTPNR